MNLPCGAGDTWASSTLLNLMERRRVMHYSIGRDFREYVTEGARIDIVGSHAYIVGTNGLAVFDVSDTESWEPEEVPSCCTMLCEGTNCSIQ